MASTKLLARRSIATALGLSAALGMSVALSVSGPVAQAQAAQPAALAPVGAGQLALGHLDSIVVGNYAAVVGAFDPRLRGQLNTDGLARAWADFQRTHGIYRAHGAPLVAPRGELSVVTVPLSMSYQRAQFQITFHADGRIAGLYLLNA